MPSLHGEGSCLVKGQLSVVQNLEQKQAHRVTRPITVPCRQLAQSMIGSAIKSVDNSLLNVDKPQPTIHA